MANCGLQRGWEARVPKAWKFTRFGTVQDMFLHFLCLVLGNCFWKCRYVIWRFPKTCKNAGAALLPQFLFPRGHCRYNPANYCKISWAGSCLHGIYIGFRPPLKQLTFVSKHRWQTVVCRGGGKQECLKHGNSQGLAPFKTCFYIFYVLFWGIASGKMSVRCLGGFQKLVKLQVLSYFPSFFSLEGIVGTILQIIVKLVGQGSVCMVFT